MITTCMAGWLLYSSREDLLLFLNLHFYNVLSLYLIYLLQFLISTIPFLLIIHRYRDSSIPIIEWFKIMFVSRMANNLVSKSGSVYKAYILKNSFDFTYTHYFHVATMYSWLKVFVNLVLVSLCLLFFMPDLKFGDYSALLIMGCLSIVIFLSPFIIDRLFHLIKPKSGFIFMIYNKVAGIIAALVENAKDITFMAKLISLIFIQFGLYIVLFKILFTGVNIDIGYAELSLFIAIQQVSVLLFITPGNIGVRELLYGVVGGAIGIGIAEGVVVSALLRVVTYLVIFPLGLAFGGIKIFQTDKERYANQ